MNDMQALYMRSAWQKTIDDAKVGMGLMPAFTQDRLDRDLVRAVLDGDVVNVREMAALGADVHRQLTAPASGTVLHLAARRGSLKAVVALLHLGADPALRDAAGLTPRDVTGQRRLAAVLKLWEQRMTRNPQQLQKIAG